MIGWKKGSVMTVGFGCKKFICGSMILGTSSTLLEMSM